MIDREDISKRPSTRGRFPFEAPLDFGEFAIGLDRAIAIGVHVEAQPFDRFAARAQADLDVRALLAGDERDLEVGVEDGHRWRWVDRLLGAVLGAVLGNVLGTVFGGARLILCDRRRRAEDSRGEREHEEDGSNAHRQASAILLPKVIRSSRSGRCSAPSTLIARMASRRGRRPARLASWTARPGRAFSSRMTGP